MRFFFFLNLAKTLMEIVKKKRTAAGTFTYTLASIQFRLECPLAMQGFAGRPPHCQPPTPHFPGQLMHNKNKLPATKAEVETKKPKEK